MTAGPRISEVRRLRHALGEALYAEGRREQALEQFLFSVREPGATPPDAELLERIGRVREDLADSAGALEAHLKAVISDPTHQASVLAGLRLLPSHPPAQAWHGLGFELAASIRRAAVADSAAWLLAARLLRHVDEGREAAALLEAATQRGGDNASALVDELIDTYLELDDSDRARALLETVPSVAAPTGRAHLLLTEGRLREVLASVGTDAPPRALAARIYALIGLGRTEEAVDASPSRAPDVTAARISALLAAQRYDRARELVDDIMEETDEPARHLVQAQVLLEAAGSASTDGFAEVDRARKALKRLRRLEDSGLEEITARTLRHPWLRLQRQVRGDDDRFTYASAEIIVAIDKDPERRRSAVEACRRTRTTSLQDAALDELAVEVLPDDAPAARRAELLTAAALSADGRDDPVRALPLAREAVKVAPTVERRCDYAEVAWRASYFDKADVAASVSRIEEALDLLTGGEEMSRPDVGWRPANVLGLCLLRITELRDGGRRPLAAWQAIPYLLLSALASTPDSYRFTHLASAFSMSGATWAASLSAERALELSPTDPWVLETRLVALTNHSGRYEVIAPEIDRYEQVEGVDAHWAEVLRAVVAAVDGRARDDVATTPPEPPEQPWARWPYLALRVITSGVASCVGELETLAEDLRTEGDDPDGLATVLRCLGRLDDADAVITDAEADGFVNAHAARRARALTDLLRDGRAAEAQAALDEEYRRELVPYSLREAINIELPVLRAVAPGLADIVGHLLRTCTARLTELEAQPPPLTTELEAAEGLVPSAEMVRLCLDLLEAGEHAPWSVLADAADRVASAPAPGLLAPARTELRARVARQAAEGAIEASVAGGDPGPDELVRLADRLQPVLDAETLARLRITSWSAMPDSSARSALLRSVAEQATDAVVADALAELSLEEAARGELPQARDIYIYAQQVEDAAEAFDASLSRRVDSMARYRAVQALLAGVADDPLTDAAVRACAAGTRARVEGRLDDVLGLDQDTRESPYSVVTPIVLEAGAGIVDLVDPAQDGGTFIDQYIPEMKGRIFAAAGVQVPGVRLRPSYVLPARGYLIQVDEVPVTQGELPATGVLVEEVDATRRLTGGVERTRWHPVTGSPGSWGLRPPPEGATNRGTADVVLNPARHLLFALESTLRRHLWRFASIDAVTGLAEEWRATDRALVSEVLPDDAAVRRLTWLVRSLLRDGLTIADWPALLTAVHDGGGLEQPLPVLREKVVPFLQQPPEAMGEEPLVLPEDLETEAGDPANPLARVRLLTWLRRAVDEHGPALSVQVRTVHGGEVVSDLGRTVTSDLVVMLRTRATV